MPIRRTLLALIWAPGLVVACSRPTTTPAPVAQTPVATPVVVTGAIDVNPYRMTMTCTGQGSPAMVLSGYIAGSSPLWTPVQPALTTLSRVCVYELSSEAFKRLTSELMVKGLHDVLHAMDIDGPYVHVAWGFGGYNARLYASMYRNEVAGLVLVDTNHEDYFTRFRLLLPPDPAGEESNPYQALENELSGKFRDIIDTEASAAQVKAARRSLGALPLVVIARGKSDWPGELRREARTKFDQAWQEQQDDLKTLSANSLLVKAATSGHNVVQDQPDLVIDATRKVLTAARASSPLAP